MMLRAWLDEFSLGVLDELPLRKLLLDGSGGVPRLLEAARPMLERTVSAGTDPSSALQEWGLRQKVTGEDTGLPAELTGIYVELAELIKERAEDFTIVQELLTAGRQPVLPPLNELLVLFADLGLVRAGDAKREGIALTPLGRLVARSISKP